MDQNRYAPKNLYGDARNEMNAIAPPVSLAKVGPQPEPKPMINMVDLSVPKSGPEIKEEMEEEVEVKPGIMDRLKQNKIIKWPLFIIMMGSIFAEFALDWWFLYDVWKIERGLVFGPVDDEIIISLLVFNCTGTICFILEMGNVIKEFFQKPWVPGDVAAVVTTWCEDVPQMILSAAIAACHEIAISYIQIVRAGFLLFMVLVRVLSTGIRYCVADKERSKWNKKVTPNVTIGIRIFIMFGLIINFVCSCMVFGFTNFAVRFDEGIMVKFKNPTGIFSGELDYGRYFDGVALYLSHDTLNAGCPVSERNYLKLTDIDNIRNTEGGVKFEYDFVETQNGYEYLIKSSKDTSWGQTFCFEKDKNCNFTVQPCTSLNMQGNHTNLSMKFVYDSPTKYMVFGDIDSDIKIKTGSNCSLLSSQTGEKSLVKYFSNSTKVDIEYPLDKTESGSWELYKATEKAKTGCILGVYEYWKTGFWGCDPEGRLGPDVIPLPNFTC